MKQLVQNLKTGKMELLEVPLPALHKGYVLVRNHFSLISAGTEGSKVKTARASLLQKAKKKPDQVKQVVESVKTEGLEATYKKVMNKLDFPSPLGYSCAGEVMAVGEGVTSFRTGDRVACGGTSALHGEVVAVPVNLCVKVPQKINMAHAAFTTVSSIAMQGIRQADVRLGEIVVVIGLGLIGQLTIQLLAASGVRALGIDIDDKAVELARISGAVQAYNRSNPGLEQLILEESRGYGVDAVIITAGTSSTDPVELAGKLCRKKGKVIIVGAVPTGFSRPNYYKKELELRMSASYGPGRYDDNYEEKGLDYPIGYVRWTENRNMQAYLELLAAGKLNIEALLSHTFSFEKALEAYEIIMHKTEPFIGMVLQYDTAKDLSPDIHFKTIQNKNGEAPAVGFIGAGSFAQKSLLPNVVKSARMVAVATATGNNAANIAHKYGFETATGEASTVLNHKEINTVFIATRHNTHASYVLKALKNDKNVFVEKPLALHRNELEQIKAEYEKHNSRLMVGFNRRFAPLIVKMMSHFEPGAAKSMLYRVNVGHIPRDHWTQDPQVGGGRIIGEVCHFVDLCMFVAGSRPLSVSAHALDAGQEIWDTLVINLNFENGSVASISYFANGSKSLDKEYMEVYGSGVTAVLKDFKKLEIHTSGKKSFTSAQDKGHSREVEAFMKAVREGAEAPIPFEDIYISSLLPFKIIESIQSGKTIALF